jgi:hypothetical protein
MMASVVTSQIEKKTPQFQCVKFKKIQNIKIKKIVKWKLVM